MLTTESLQEGHYARKQIFSRSWLISWSHRGRFQTGVQLASRLAGKRIVDYGAGDGTFLAMAMAAPSAPATAVGAELNDEVLFDCQNRFGEDSRLAFVRIDQLNQPEFAQSFDGLVCMEVLEHVVDWQPVLSLWEHIVRPGGTILVSVPVETGLALVVKQIARRVAGWRGIGDYPGMAPYTWHEFWSSLWARDQHPFVRPIHRSPDGFASHCHKGFNWRVLQTVLAERFVLERTLSSPLIWLPPGFGSQVWFVLRKV